MADEQVLTQDEVDALTTAVEEGEISTDSPNNPGEFTKVDFSNQERIIRTQFPVLSRIYERLTKKLSSSLYGLLAQEAEISYEDPGVQRFGDYLASLGMPSSIYAIKLNPLRAKSFIVMDSNLISALVEKYFGGDCSHLVSIEDREFTQTEQRIISLIMNILVTDLMDSWAPILKVTIENAGFDMNPQLVNAAGSDDSMIVTKFTVKFEEIEGKFQIIVPYTSLELIREQLDLGAARADEEVDDNWVKSIQREILDVPVELSSVLTETQVSLSEILAMKVGDVIPVELPEVVTLSVENVPSYKAKYGVANDKCSLKIISKMSR